MGDMEHSKFEEMALRLYRKQLKTEDHSGIIEDGRLYVSKVLDKYRPIKNEEHLILMMAAHAGLQWGKLKPFSDLVKSGYPIPQEIRDSFCGLIEGNCPFGYIVIPEKIHPKYRGKKSNTPPEKAQLHSRNLNMWWRYKREMDKPENNRTTAVSILEEQYEYWSNRLSSDDNILKSTFKKIVEGKKPQ